MDAYDDITVCFYPHLLTKEDGISFLDGLSPLLKPYRRLVPKKLVISD